MKLYFAPEFSRIVEAAPARVQNITKVVSKYLTDHVWDEALKHPKFSIKPTKEGDLYILHFDELRYFIALHRDENGEYAILVNLDQGTRAVAETSLMRPNPPYDYVHARARIVRGIVEFVRSTINEQQVSFKAEAIPPDQRLLSQAESGESLETGGVKITYSFNSPLGNRLPEITIMVDHDSAWRVSADLICERTRQNLIQYEAWDWKRILDATISALMVLHRTLQQR